VAISKPDVSQIYLPAGSSDAKDIAILENYIVCLRESIVNDRPPSLLYQLLKFIQGNLSD
jgi:hypothetical protein